MKKKQIFTVKKLFSILCFSTFQFLAENNMAFHCSVDKLNQPHNGNFLVPVEFLAKFDAGPYKKD